MSIYMCVCVCIYICIYISSTGKNTKSREVSINHQIIKSSTLLLPLGSEIQYYYYNQRSFDTKKNLYSCLTQC